MIGLMYSGRSNTAAWPASGTILPRASGIRPRRVWPPSPGCRGSRARPSLPGRGGGNAGVQPAGAGLEKKRMTRVPLASLPSRDLSGSMPIANDRR